MSSPETVDSKTEAVYCFILDDTQQLYVCRQDVTYHVFEVESSVIHFATLLFRATQKSTY